MAFYFLFLEGVVHNLIDNWLRYYLEWKKEFVGIRNIPIYPSSVRPTDLTNLAERYGLSLN